MRASLAALAVTAVAALAPTAAGAEPLRATAPAATADGTALVPVTVTGGPPRDDAERPEEPALPAVTCPGAATLPPTGGVPPRVVAPFLLRGGTLACTVRLRDATAPLTLRLHPPPSGAYAVLDQPGAAATATSLTLRTLVVAPGGASRPGGRVRAAASAGVTATTDRDVVRLALPGGTAPRAVAVALEIDGRPAAAFFPVMGRVEIPVRTQRAQTVVVRLPGRYAGPFAVHGNRLEAPVAVPPGVSTAVVRALSARGEAREELVDLAPPRFPTLAVLWPAGPLVAGQSRSIIVAVASPQGAAARGATPPAVRADRGTVAAARPRGPGLWEIAYRAPATPGAAHLRVVGPDGSGAAATSLTVVPGGPHRLEVTLPRGPLAPGELLRARVVVRDAAGTLLPGVRPQATLDGAPARVEVAGAERFVVAPVPGRLPPGRRLTLRVEAGAAVMRVPVPVRAGAAARARLVLRPAGRRATLALAVEDRFGNEVGADGVTLGVEGGRVGPLRAAGSGLVGTVEAATTARRAVVTVAADGRVLSREAVRFAPPPRALLVGVWAGAGWLGNLGALSAPRFGGGAAVRRGVGPLELALAAGVEGLVWSDQGTSLVAGEERAVTRSLTTVAVPVTLRARLPLPHRFGVGAGVTVAPTWARGSVDPHFQEAERFTALVVGVRGEVVGDVALGPGRVVVGVGYGRAVLSGTPITGNVDGLYARVAYEWWLWDPGR